MGKNRKICVVIPTYNERENIGVLLEKILEVAGRRQLPLSIIVVDDNSPDGTAELVEEYSKRFPMVHLLRRARKTGLGSAYKAGFAKALNELEAEILVEMDADGSHNPEHLPAIIEKMFQGFDVVVGSRYIPGSSIEGWGWKRRLISWGANLLARWLLGVKVRDATSGYRAYRAEALRKAGFEEALSKGFAFQAEMLFRAGRAGLKLGEVPIAFTDRLRAKSKLGSGEMKEYLLLCLKLFSWRMLGWRPKVG